jgi:hypothetical protein
MAALGMRLSTAVAVVSEAVQARIAQHVEKCERDRELLLLLSTLEGSGALPPARPAAAPTKPIGKRPAAGSLPARILDIIGEQDDDQVTFAQILAGKPGAPDETVRYNLYRLVKAGWIVATGNTSQRRYSLPTKKGGK